MIRALLVFPPGWSPVGPYLALPVLKSYLKEKRGIDVEIIDLNVEFYDQLLSLNNIKKCMKRFSSLKSCFSDQVGVTEELIKSSALEVEDAKSIFRSERYFDLDQRQYAENVFRNALYIINHSSGGTKFTFNSIDLPYSYYSTSDVMCSYSFVNPSVRVFRHFLSMIRPTLDGSSEPSPRVVSRTRTSCGRA